MVAGNEIVVPSPYRIVCVCAGMFADELIVCVNVLRVSVSVHAVESSMSSFGPPKNVDR